MTGETCTSRHPGNGRRCTKPLFHKGQHSCGPSVVDHWTSKMPKPKPLASKALGREQLEAKFRDTPGQGAMDLATGETVWED